MPHNELLHRMASGFAFGHAVSRSLAGGKMSYQVNITDIERALEFLGGEAQAKSIQDHILKSHCNDEIPRRYMHERSFRQTIQRMIEDYCPEAEGFEVKGKEPKFHRVGHGTYRLMAYHNLPHSPSVSENIENSDTYTEGGKRHISTTAYERDPKARAKCIEHYGTNCAVCCVNFEKTYGDIGRGFIHVHHLRPLATIRKEYQLDPIRDLRPVCPNCHAMLHKKDPPFSIDELIKRI